MAFELRYPSMNNVLAKKENANIRWENWLESIGYRADGGEVRAEDVVLTVDRPGARNAISLATMDALGVALDWVADASALVINGGGDRAFVSGGDLKDLAKLRTHDEATEMALRMRRLCDRIATFPAPVIAALNGHALGGGAEVAVAADIRVAADDVTIAFNQSRLAIMPAWGGAERLAADRRATAGGAARDKQASEFPRPRRCGSDCSTASTRARRSSHPGGRWPRPFAASPSRGVLSSHRGGRAPPPSRT